VLTCVDDVSEIGEAMVCPPPVCSGEAWIVAFGRAAS
jgi:hypothetical protein